MGALGAGAGLEGAALVSESQVARRFVGLLPCREAERAAWKERNLSYPVILRNYRANIPSHSLTGLKGDVQPLSSHPAHPLGAHTSTPAPHHPASHHPHFNRQSQDIKSAKKVSKLHYTFYDGSSFV